MSNYNNPLFDIFFNNAGNSIHKWVDYFDVYHKTFSRFIDKKIRLLEIGVQNGGSTRMWKKYFGDQVEIVCVDIDPACKELEKDGFDVWIGDQESFEFWNELKSKYDSFDIVIDDGGHTMSQQINTFESLFPILNDNGVYLCEDTCTSYFECFGGGLNNEKSFIEYSKKLVDEIHGWWFKKQDELESNYLILESLNSIEFYDSIIVFNKRRRNPPVSYSRGLIGHIKNPVSLTYQDLRKMYGIGS